MKNNNPSDANITVDVAIIGGGLAGLSTAVRLANNGLHVCIIAKTALSEGSSLYAQGGIAAVQGGSDSFQSHFADTMKAGAGLCDPEVVEFVVSRGPQAVQWLIDLGVHFTEDDEAAGDSKYHLAREGGHSHRRIVHSDDATGAAVETTMQSLALQHPNIRVLEYCIAIELITSAKINKHDVDMRQAKTRCAPRCLGVYAHDIPSGTMHTLSAPIVVLASGGASKAYLYTSNPDTSTGDGIAMAWRAGCRVANMEFVQFHPTCLYHPHARSFLISEAVRGEGGKLLLPNGEAFMHRHDARGELAPRDIVARAIDYEMKRGGHDCVYLDISHKPTDFIRNHFPNIYAKCAEFNYDMTRAPLPVVPAAHYTCGGIVTDITGTTDIGNLYAIGECACTGLHGANRLASNSLLECLVFAEAAARDIVRKIKDGAPPSPALPPWDESRVIDADEQIVVSHNWEELRRLMWDYVGIVRTTRRLQRAAHRIALLQQEIDEYYGNFKVNNDLIELRNLVLVSELIVKSARHRRESRGLHYTLDYPGTPPAEGAPTVLQPPRGEYP